MQPQTPQDFLRVAAQRLVAAERIFQLTSLNLEAQYIGGYAIECALKALILENEDEPSGQRAAMLTRLTKGAQHHRADVLIGYLRSQGVSLPSELITRLRRFDWDVDLRYETGRRDTGETRGSLRTA